jgi:hypothetical protein
MALNEGLSIVFPYVNLLLVIVVIALFIRMFVREAHAHVYLIPWKLLFAGVIIFVVEQVLTVLRQAGVINIPGHGIVNGLFEIVIITLFIYMLLLQREHIIAEGY